MKPNELFKKGASLIGWFVNPRGNSYYDPCQTNGNGSLFCVNGTLNAADFPVNSFVQRNIFPIQENITTDGIVVPAGGAYTQIAILELGIGPWSVFLQNSGANVTSNIRIIGYPGDPANPMYAAAGVQHAAGPYALVAGASGIFNSVLATYAATNPVSGGPRFIKVEIASALGTTIKCFLVRQKNTNP